MAKDFLRGHQHYQTGKVFKGCDAGSEGGGNSSFSRMSGEYAGVFQTIFMFWAI